MLPLCYRCMKGRGMVEIDRLYQYLRGTMGVKHYVMVFLMITCLAFVLSALNGKSAQSDERVKGNSISASGKLVNVDHMVVQYRQALAGRWPEELSRNIFVCPPGSDAKSDGNPVPDKARLSARSPNGLKLTAIIQGIQVRVIINNKMMGVGDTIQGCRIVEINSRYVLLESDGIRYSISM